MAKFVAAAAAAVIVLCVPMAILKPKWVFYVYLTSVTFSRIFGGYVYAAGNLGMPRAWNPADILFFLTLFAAMFVHREKRFRAGTIEKCLLILSLMSIFSLMQGLLLHFHTAVSMSRMTHFIGAAVFGLRYLTSYSRVEEFLKFTCGLLVAMFVIHVLIRFAIYTPPTSETDLVSQLGGERGTNSLVLQLYLMLISVSIGRLVSKTGRSVVYVLTLLIGLSGIVLSETRSTFGAVGVLVLASAVFIKGRTKTLVLVCVVALVAVYLAGALGFDFLARFKEDHGKGAVVNPLEKLSGWRNMEYGMVAISYKNEPLFILTGRGLGALHPAPSGKSRHIAYYHSEYLGWLDRCGLIGLGGVIVMTLACLRQGLRLAKSDSPRLRCYGTVCFLLMISMMAEGLFHPIFSHMSGASLVTCFVVVLANWQYIAESLRVEAPVPVLSHAGGAEWNGRQRIRPW